MSVKIAESEIVDAAKQFLEGKAGAIETARRISGWSTDLPYRNSDEDIMAMVAADSETDHLLIGDKHSLYHESVQQERRDEFLRYESSMRADIAAACKSLLEKLAKWSEPPQQG